MTSEANRPASNTYTDEGHIYRFVVNPGGPFGWDVHVERDAEVLWKTHYTDWHRVERARWIFNSRSAHPNTRH